MSEPKRDDEGRDEYLERCGWTWSEHRKTGIIYWSHPSLDGLCPEAEAFEYQKRLEWLEAREEGR